MQEQKIRYSLQNKISKLYFKNKLEINIKNIFFNNIQIKESHNPHEQGIHKEIYDLKWMKNNSKRKWKTSAMKSKLYKPKTKSDRQKMYHTRKYQIY